MRFLTKHECEQFAGVIGIGRGELEQISSEGALRPAIRLSIENERHRSYFLATRLVTLLGRFEEALVWVTEYGIWPTSENQWLYYRLRTAMGDNSTLADRPGHLLAATEKDALIAYVHLGLEFGWGIYLMSRPSVRYAYVSHDGWARLAYSVGDTAVLAEVADWSIPFEAEAQISAPRPH